MKHLTTVRSSDTYFLTIGNYDITVPTCNSKNYIDIGTYVVIYTYTNRSDVNIINIGLGTTERQLLHETLKMFTLTQIFCLHSSIDTQPTQHVVFKIIMY